VGQKRQTLVRAGGNETTGKGRGKKRLIGGKRGEGRSNVHVKKREKERAIGG